MYHAAQIYSTNHIDRLWLHGKYRLRGEFELAAAKCLNGPKGLCCFKLASWQLFAVLRTLAKEMNPAMKFSHNCACLFKQIRKEQAPPATVLLK